MRKSWFKSKSGFNFPSPAALLGCRMQLPENALMGASQRMLAIAGNGWGSPLGELAVPLSITSTEQRAPGEYREDRRVCWIDQEREFSGTFSEIPDLQPGGRPTFIQ